jgi:hypothetical protein
MAKFWVVYDEAAGVITGGHYEDKQTAINEAVAMSQGSAGKFEVLESMGEAAPVVSVTYTEF